MKTSENMAVEQEQTPNKSSSEQSAQVKENTHISTIAQTFCQSSEQVISHTPLGQGLINQTYLVTTNLQKFVLQKINSNVFPKPLQVIENADLISEFLQTKSKNNEYPFTAIHQLTSECGKSYSIENNNYWRALSFVENCFTIQAVESNEQASFAASAFAKFTRTLNSFDATKLHEIIPNFHHLASRIEQLTQSKLTATTARLSMAKTALEFVASQQSFIDEVAAITEKLPLHVTHNDTKINNLLFDNSSRQATAVIDLDTCMPGFLMHDFGDMVRTCCGNLAEDAENTEDMEVRLDVFQALAEAYISGFSGDITELEKQSLVIGALLLPFMIGTRFLTDYLNNDVYFHTLFEGHNLVRANNQFKLFALLNAKRKQLQEIIANA